MEKITFQTVGPFGGQGGSSWNDGTYTGVRQLVIYSGSVIDSIQIEYDQNGQSKWSQKHGESNGGVKNTVMLEYPDECLVSVLGHYGQALGHLLVRSLTIKSNKRTYGPFGVEEGESFKFPSTNDKITGFHGRSGLYLDSIGAHFRPVQIFSVGPFGGPGGNQWDDGIYTGVKQLIISSRTVIDYIKIEYDKNGQSEWSQKHGESHGGGENSVKLDYPGEFLVSVSGHYGQALGHLLVRSLTIKSNKRTYGPFGVEEGESFKFPSTNSMITGFHGTSGWHLDSIGAHFRPIPIVSVGPFGGLGGSQWDDGIYTGVKQLIISSRTAIDYIKIEYDKNGQSEWSQKHGESHGGGENTVKLDYPGEFLVSVSGHYGQALGHLLVRSLTIKSNKRIYGPFGVEAGESFEFPSTNGVITGFHGTSGWHLDSIGAHYRLDQIFSIGPFGGLGGSQWDDGIYTGVKQLIISSRAVIDYIKIEYDKNGQSEWSQKHGESHGGGENTVKLDYPGEFLVSVSGHYGQALGHLLVRSLTIKSNKRTYGPFGVEEGESFKFPSTNGKIIGFHGMSGWHLDSIGAHFRPIQIFSVGPFGGPGGSQWDDGIYTGVKQLIISSGEVIDSIKIEYDKNGQSEWSQKHGESSGGGKNTVKLEYPDEFLVSVSGHYGQALGHLLVRSLTIKSNKRTYGPFGVEEGESFMFPSANGKITGFHGRSGLYLDSIGANVEQGPHP